VVGGGLGFALFSVMVIGVILWLVVGSGRFALFIFGMNSS
jgi:hypothetical protein